MWQHHHCWIAAVPQHQPLWQRQLLQHLPQLLPSACQLLLAAHTHAQTVMHQLLCQVSALLDVAAPSLLDRCCEPLCQQQLLKHLPQLLPSACHLLPVAHTCTDSHTAVSVSIKTLDKGTVSLAVSP